MSTLAPRILLVEDEPDIIVEVAGFLRRRGELVKTANGFAEGLLALRDASEPIDLLLADIRMPDGSGMDLVRITLERPAGSCPAILMTSHLDSEGLEPALEGVGVRLLYKPFTMSSLYREVRAALDRPRGPAPSFAQLPTGVPS